MSVSKLERKPNAKECLPYASYHTDSDVTPTFYTPYTPYIPCIEQLHVPDTPAELLDSSPPPSTSSEPHKTEAEQSTVPPKTRSLLGRLAFAAYEATTRAAERFNDFRHTVHTKSALLAKKIRGDISQRSLGRTTLAGTVALGSLLITSGLFMKIGHHADTAFADTPELHHGLGEPSSMFDSLHTHGQAAPDESGNTQLYDSGTPDPATVTVHNITMHVDEGSLSAFQRAGLPDELAHKLAFGTDPLAMDIKKDLVEKGYAYWANDHVVGMNASLKTGPLQEYLTKLAESKSPAQSPVVANLPKIATPTRESNVVPGILTLGSALLAAGGLGLAIHRSRKAQAKAKPLRAEQQKDPEAYQTKQLEQAKALYASLREQLTPNQAAHFKPYVRIYETVIEHLRQEAYPFLRGRAQERAVEAVARPLREAIGIQPFYTRKGVLSTKTKDNRRIIERITSKEEIAARKAYVDAARSFDPSTADTATSAEPSQFLPDGAILFGTPRPIQPQYA